jgi:protein-disulfide isomerase
MAMARTVLALAFAALLGAGGSSGCGASDYSSNAPGPDVDLPGVDTHEFTARERHEFSQYVTQLPAPCKDVAVPVAQCVQEHRACPACLQAAQSVAKAVREGLSSEQVQAAYKQRFDPSSTRAIPVDGSPSRGPEDAPVTLVEFADFECPFCQRIAPELDKLWEARKDKVRFVYKFYPLSMHPHGEISARAAIAAAAQGKFWEMNKRLFAAGQRLDKPDLEAYAVALGLDLDKFRADMNSPETQARLDADHKLADDLNVHGTPTIFVDGRLFDSKADLGEWLDQEIAAHR